MENKTFFDKLKTKWDIKSNSQVFLILIVFALAGSSIVVFRNPVFNLLGLDKEASIWLKTIAYMVLMLPIYQGLLLFYGLIFGQVDFFWSKQKKIYSRIFKKKSK